MHLKQWIACASLCAASLAAHAAAPTYAGTLGTGTFAGTVEAESGPFGTPEKWSLWTFTAPWMANVTLTVTPTSPDLDPYIAVFYGKETDLSNYFDMTTGSVLSPLVAHADGAVPFGPDGRGDPARISFVNDYGHETFVLAIADYVDGVGNGLLGYSITAAVPEPSTYALLIGGLALVGAAARRRRG